MDGKGDRKLPFGIQAQDTQNIFYHKRGLIDSTVLPQAQVVEKYKYTARKWLDSLSATKGTNELFRQKLKFDFTGNIVKQTTKHLADAELVLDYDYDKINRLKTWSSTGFSVLTGERYYYDKVGNRTLKYIYDYSPFLSDSLEYEYDNGNNQLTGFSKTEHSADTFSYSRLITTTNRYTGDGALQIRQHKDVIQNFLYTHTSVTRDVFGYGYNGLLKKFGQSYWGKSGNLEDDCFMDTTAAPQWQWEYRYNAGGERESKRHVADPWNGAYSGHTHLWTYYLLGGSKQQLAVYNGRETTETNACSDTGHRVHFYPTEYLTYGNGMSALITTRPDSTHEYKIVDHLGSTRVVLNDTGRIISSMDFEPFGKVYAQGESYTMDENYKQRDWENLTPQLSDEAGIDRSKIDVAYSESMESNHVTIPRDGQNPLIIMNRGGYENVDESNLNNARSSIQHEKKHATEAVAGKIKSTEPAKGVAESEVRAVNHQKSHPSWKNTSDSYKAFVNKYKSDNEKIIKDIEKIEKETGGK
ncbi:MAG: hypothetical protein HYZ54_07375 [Ignavibacteriae bacterium]|nr:hypothetical protein [Ignavibacteriota bacterium]